MRPSPPPQRADTTRRVDLDPEGIVVGDGWRHRQNARIGRPTERRLDEAHEVAGATPRVHRRDERPIAGEAPIDLEEALQRRPGGLDDDLGVEVGEPGVEPITTLPGLLVHDDDERGDARGAEVLDHPLDQRHARDRDQRFGHREARRPQAGAVARGDDAAATARRHRHGSISPSSRSERMTRSPRQHGRGSAAAAGTSQMCAMPTLRAPAMSRDSESPTNVASAGFTPSSTSASLKTRGSGFFHPTAREAAIAWNNDRIPRSSQTVARLP